jgi:hypothetical protein
LKKAKRDSSLPQTFRLAGARRKENVGLPRTECDACQPWIWNYTTEKARPIEYGVGDFLYTEAGGGRTHMTWTYSFKLKEHNFPGYFGGFGRLLFRKYFLEREYAQLMRGVLNGYKADAEQGPAGEG